MMRVICRFKLLSIIVLSFIVFSSKGQIYQVMPQYGYKFNRFSSDSTLHIPSFCGVPNITDYIKNGMLAIDTCNNVLFQWTRTNGWTPISTGTYLDTISLSNRINDKIDSLKFSGDSVYAIKRRIINGVSSTINTFQYKNPYFKTADTILLSNRINQKLNMVDTASLSNRINLKLNILDTSSLARKTTTITPNAPLTGGGSLAANRTISISKSTASVDGYLSSTDFNRFAGVLNNVIAREPLYRFKYYGGTSSYNPDSIAINIRQANDTTNGYLGYSSFLTFGNKVDSVYKTGDTLYVINGNKDIIPTSRTKKYYLGGIAIDTTNRFVNNVIKINDSTFRVFKGSSSSDIYLKSSIDTISLSNRIDNKVPYTGAIKDVDLDIYKLAAQSIMVNGTNGNGHIDLKRQTSDATATGQSTALFANSNGDLKWKYSGTTYTTLQTRQTADRVYSFQNKSYTLGDSADVAGKLNIADTSDMLFKYLRRSDTTSMLSKYLRKTDTSSLSNRINLKVNISDTSSMLNTYLRKVDTTNKFVNRLQRIAGKDSIIFYVGSTRYAIKDSTGGGGGSAAGSNGLIQFNLNGSFGADSSLFWDNTNKRLGVGITTPLVKLDVRQGIKDDMPRNYEIANFTKKGDTKLGVYTADTYASGSGSSISLGNSKNLNADGYYPGFEFQNVNDSASNTGYVRYNFVEKGIDGNVALAAVNLFTINSNGTVQINPTGYGLSPVPRLIVGGDNTGESALEVTGSNTTLHCTFSNSYPIIKIENESGYPLNIYSVDEPINGAYTGIKGSISNTPNGLYENQDNYANWRKMTRPYRSYVAQLSQSGSNAPVATILENDLGYTPTWSRLSAGSYTLSSTELSGENADKVVVFLTQGNYPSNGQELGWSSNVGWDRDGHTVFISTAYNNGNTEIPGYNQADDILSDGSGDDFWRASFELRIYD